MESEFTVPALTVASPKGTKQYFHSLPPIWRGSLVNTRKRSEVNSWGAFELDDTCLLAMKRVTFTSREQEVAAGIVRGFSNKEIARHLSISEHTVKDHVRAMYKKTGSAKQNTVHPTVVVEKR